MFNYVLFCKDELLYSFGKKELNMPKIGPLFHKFKMVRLSIKSTFNNRCDKGIGPRVGL